MDSNLEETLRQRQEDDECIICAKKLDDKAIPQIILQHFILGPVIICESHIKQSGNDE